MNLVADIGNSRIKAALTSAGKLVRQATLSHTGLKELGVFADISETKGKCLYASVSDHPAEILRVLASEGWVPVALTPETPLPFTIEYRSPETLGKDRIAAIAGACTIYPGATVMVIDAGTAITYDYLVDGNRYLGGNISPGLSMRFRALHEFTHSLPECTTRPQHPEIGYDTPTAIIAGVQQSVIFEINEYIRQFQKLYPASPVILTGGDAHFLEPFLSEGIHLEADVVLRGLNRILEHHE